MDGFLHCKVEKRKTTLTKSDKNLQRICKNCFESDLEPPGNLNQIKGTWQGPGCGVDNT